MLVGAPRGAGVTQITPFVRSNPDTPPGAIRALRLVGAPTPSISRETEEEEEGDPLARRTQTGADIILTFYKSAQHNALFDN
jgi:hypothetical protein